MLHTDFIDIQVNVFRIMVPNASKEMLSKEKERMSIMKDSISNIRQKSAFQTKLIIDDETLIILY